MVIAKEQRYWCQNIFFFTRRDLFHIFTYLKMQQEVKKSSMKTDTDTFPAQFNQYG